MTGKSDITISVTHHCIADVSSPIRALAAAGAEGLDMVEFFGSDFTMEDLGSIRRHAASQGLLLAWHPWLNIAGLRWAAGIAGCLEDIVEDAVVMGASNIVMHMGEAPPDERRSHLVSVVEGFRMASRRALAAGVRFAVENVPSYVPGVLGDEFEDFEFLFSQTDPAAVGFTLDTGHALMKGGCLEWLGRFRSRLIHAHIHSNDGVDDEHAPFLRGVLDWQEVLGEMMEAGFAGPYNIEFAYGKGGGALCSLLRKLASEKLAR